MSTPETPIPAPEPKKGGALKIVLIVLGVLFLIVVLAVGGLIYVGYHIAHSLHAGHGNSVSILGTNVSTIDSGSLTSADLGTDIYPGATPTAQGSRIDLPTASITTGTYLTTDPFAKVDAFYKDKLGVGTTAFGSGDPAIFSKKVSDQETIMVTITDKNTETGKTKVIIQHTKKK